MKHLLFLPIILLFSSCLSLKPVTVDKVSNLNINSPNRDEIEVVLTLKINNPNKFAITVKKIDLNVNAGGIDLGPILVDQKIKIPGNSVTDQIFKFKTSLSSLGSAALPAAMALISKGNLKIHATGKIKARAFIISKNFKIDFTDQVKLK